MQQFEKYIADFAKKLEAVLIDTISPELYLRKYLTHLINHKAYYLRIYADVFCKLIKAHGNGEETITLVDYGAGNGLLGLFAKFCGFKKVFINDVNPDCIQASKQLAEQLNIVPDGYITGDISILKSFFQDEIPNAIAGTDVIEHIYDLSLFFNTLQEINPAIVSVFTTASNPHNYFKVKALQKLQLKDELRGVNEEDIKLYGENNTKPFLKVREEMIRGYRNDFSDTVVKELAAATRGKNKNDIIKAVENYSATKKLPIPAAGSNTCNPFDGSWAERILPLSTYRSIYNAAGFKVNFFNGFYNEYDEQGLRKIMKKSLNFFVKIFGDSVAPYIILIGKG